MRVLAILIALTWATVGLISGYAISSGDDTPSTPQTIRVSSPLYDAEIDPQRRVCVRLMCRVRGEDCVRDHNTDRNWWTHGDLEPHCLEDADYIDSGYDRGHLRAIAWSHGSDHWRDVNCMAVIVPQPPACNRGAIRELEERVAALAVERGYCDVTITCLFEAVMHPLENADEDHVIPSGFQYHVVYPGGTIDRTIQTFSGHMQRAGAD